MGKIKPGSIFAIPGGDHFGAAKVIYVSERYQDVFLIKLLLKKFDSVGAIDLDCQFESSALYYVGVESIKKGKWKLLGEQVVSDVERALSKRIVGSDVWIEDRHIGPATDDDLKRLKHMDIYGWRLIEKAVMRLV